MATPSDLKGQEIAEIVNEIRDRVRARHPGGQIGGLPLPDLLPVLHARDRAEAKVAAIGSVNPRPSGAVNALIQWIKRTIARALGWFVRDQVDFNRAVLAAVEATLESLNEVNQTFAVIGGRFREMEQGQGSLSDHAQAISDSMGAEVRELKDMREHWIHWREEWQQKLLQNEVRYLRGLADLQASYDARSAKMDENYRTLAANQHAHFEASLRRATDELQQRFWEDLEKMRRDYESIIHNELRIARQKAFASGLTAAPLNIAPSSGAGEAPIELDYNRFSDRFRGSEEYVRERQRVYLRWFTGLSNVLDIGCGRGEFLGLLKEAGTTARGLDLDPESVGLCRAKGLAAEVGDVFEWLAAQADASFDGIFASQVIEHLKPADVPRLVKLCAAKLKRDGVLALETPNPECLAIFATHFYLDPTHQRPVPPGLLVFYLEEFGFGRIEVHRLSPAADSMPSINELPQQFRDAFFGGLDYAAIAIRV